MNPIAPPDPAASPALAPWARRPQVPVRAALRWGAIGLLLVASIVIAAWLTLQWVILPRIDAWRPDIETQASRALGVPVRIGTIQAPEGGWSWVRTLELRDVTLHDRDGGQETLRLPRVRAALSPSSLLPGWDGRWRLRFEQLLIEDAQLEVRRDAAGRVHVAGLPIDGRADEGSVAADWLFSQDEFVVRGGRLRWIDEQRGLAPLLLEAVDLVVRNGVRRHDLRLDATPPSDWGERFSLSAQMAQPLPSIGPLARPGDWRRWRGTLYADLPAVDLAPLRAQVALPVDALEGRGALRAWVELRDGRPVSATADLALQAVALRIRPGTVPLAFERVHGRLGGRLDAAGGELTAERLAFVDDASRVWPAADARFTWRLGADGALAGGELQAERLDLALLAHTLGRLPPPWGGTVLPARVAALAPEGTAQDLVARWEGPIDAPTRYRLSGRIEGLALAAADGESGLGRPGVRGATLSFDTRETGGKARIALRAGSLSFPGVFEDPHIALDELDAQLEWRIEPAPDGAPSALDVRVHDLRLAHADAAGRLNAHWRSGRGSERRFPGHLTLEGRLDRADATRVARYLPRGIAAEVRDYVAHAVEAGRAEAVDFRVRGDLDHFPYAGPKPQGEFRIAAALHGVRLTYQPARENRAAWPAFTEVTGALVFEQARMQLRDFSGRVGGIGRGEFALSGVQGNIANLLDHATLEIEGRGRGPLADALAYVAVTPIDGWLNGALSPLRAEGGAQAPAELQLALVLPLFDTSRSTVRGNVLLAGNDLRLRPELPLLAGARAQIAFDERGFSLREGRARLLGGETRFVGGMSPDGPVRFDLEGRVSADGLRRTPELATWAPGLAALGGQTSYRLALGVTGGRPTWQLDSDLLGLAMDLPAPFDKPAEQAWPLRARLAALPPVGDEVRERFEVSLTAPAAAGEREAPRLQAQYLLTPGRNGPRVLAGGIGVQRPAPTPASGVGADLKLATLDVDAWRGRVDAWQASAVGPEAVPGFSPTTIEWQTDELRLGERRFQHVAGTLVRGQGREAGLWRVRARAEEFEGEAEYHPAGVRGAEGAGRIVARLQRLALPSSETEVVDSLLARAAPTRLPALDLVVQDFALRGKRLGRVEVEARNRAADDGGAGWQLDRLRLVTPEATLSATGEWLAAPHAGADRRAVMDFALDIADSGALLTRLGEAELLRGGKGRLEGRVEWLGSPWSIDYPSLAGTVKVDIGRGQFLHAEPGIAKLLGVLSLQSLPRRLAFDFRDVFGDGFAFDGLRGDLRIAQGVAETRNLRLRGVQAVVLMEGRTDLARETQDLQVWVVPEFDAGAASLAYAAINPAVGLGAFVAQWLLRRPLAEASTRQFHVTGAWADPQVERVERQPGDPIPARDAPSAPSSPPPSRPETPR